MYTHNIDNEIYVLSKKVDFMNSKFDDAYPTFNKDNSKLFFTSNREGIYNIYSNETDNTKDILEILNNTNSVPLKSTILSSPFDNKCPYILNDFMVFTSNRDSGYGRYDLYYSIYDNGEWSLPINFGNKINTKYDEFHPIC